MDVPPLLVPVVDVFSMSLWRCATWISLDIVVETSWHIHFQLPNVSSGNKKTTQVRKE